MPDFGKVLYYVNSSANPVYQAVVNKPHYMRALFVAQIKGSVWQDNLLKICKYMNGQPLTKSEDKSANKSKNKKQQSSGEAEIHTPPSVIAQSSVSKGSMIATNLMGPLDDASTADMHSSSV